MTQELYIMGQLMDLDPKTDVVLEYKSNIFGDISKIKGSSSYSISLPKTRRNMRILQNPGNPAQRSTSVRRYLQAKYYRNGIDLFGDCRAVILEVNEDSISIALTMQGLRSLSTWAEAGNSIRDLFGSGAVLPVWNSVSDYDRLVSDGIGVPVSDAGVDVNLVQEAYYAPVVTLGMLFSRIMSATGVQNYRMPADIQSDLRQLAVPFSDIISAREHYRVEASTVETGTRVEAERDSVHLNFGGFVNDPSLVGWSTLAEAFNVPADSDTFLMSFYAVMPAGTFKTTGKTFLRVMGMNEGRDFELYVREIEVRSDGSATLSYEWSQAIDASGFSWIWVEVSNVAPGTHSTYYQNTYPFLFLGQRAVKGDSLIISRSLPDLKQLDIIKFICNFYGLAILPMGTDGLDFVPYSALADNKAVALDWSDRLLGDAPDSQRGEVSFSLSDFAQRNLIQWAEDGSLEYTPAVGELYVNDITLEEEKTMATLPFSASYRDSYPFLKASLNEDGTHSLSVNGLKPRVYRLVEREDGGAAMYFSGDLFLPERIRSYYGTYQEIIAEPLTQKVECRLNEKDLRELDFSRPVYFRQFGHFYALESVRTSSDTDICEVRIIQI